MPSLTHDVVAMLLHLTHRRRMPHDDEGMAAELSAAQLRPRPFAPPRSLDRHVALRVGVRHGWRVYEMAPWGPTLPRHRVVYLHGGGYVGEIDSNHWSVCRRVATRTPARVIVPIYPVAPESTADVTVPTAAAIVADVIADAIAEGGDPSLVTIMGDSAGGGMALAVAQSLRDSGIGAPRLVLIAPWADVTMSHTQIDPTVARDPILSVPRLVRAGQLYAGDLPTSHPLVSPVNGRFDGLGPMTIFVGTRDLLLNDSRRVCAAARSAGVGVDYHEAPGLIHVWPILPLPEARLAQEAIVSAIRTPG
jgi:acetyl esterase/lipase